jgi:hypothetical protein
MLLTMIVWNFYKKSVSDHGSPAHLMSSPWGSADGKKSSLRSATSSFACAHSPGSLAHSPGLAVLIRPRCMTGAVKVATGRGARANRLAAEQKSS